MSRSSLLAAAGALTAATFAWASSASAADSVPLTCQFPLIGAVPGTITTSLASSPGAMQTPAGTLTWTADPGAPNGGHDLTGGVYGSVIATLPMSGDTELPVTILPHTSMTGPFRGGFPSVGSSAGVVPFKLGSIRLNAISSRYGLISWFPPNPAVPDSDGSPDTFDVICDVPEPAPLIATTVVTMGTPSTPAPPTETVDPITPSPTIPPTVRPTVTPTPTPTPSAGPPRLFRTFSYPLTGSATLKNLVKGSVPIVGRIKVRRDTIQGLSQTPWIEFDETSANLVALGFLPVRATVRFVPSIAAGDTVAYIPESKTNLRVQLPSFSVLGVPIAGGPACQTKNASALDLARTDDVIRTTFSISNLVGCGALTNLVSTATAGNGNAFVATVGAPTIEN